MCSIMCYTGPLDASFDESAFMQGFNKTISRGPDDTRIVRLPTGLMAYHRLAIMGLTPSGMQPFELNGSYVICNGEIYGFDRLKNNLQARYEFKSASDCEVILPLYEEYGTEFFRMLDSEFAMVIYDGKSGSFIAARDPIGIRPLYYGYDQSGTMVFASEAQNLVPLCDHVMPFPPGHYYLDGEFIPYNDISQVKLYHYDDPETISARIHDGLVAGVRKRLVSDVKLGFLLSGGLDSSLVCAIAQQYTPTPIKTFAIGMSEDAIDLKYARETADFIGSDHTEVIIDKDIVLDSLERVIELLGTYDITTIRASIGMYLVCKWIHEHTDIKVILTGEISDELFGYKYTDFAPSPYEFQKEAQKRIRELHMYDVLRADRCISVNSLEGRVPFGDLDFVEYVMSIDPEKKMNIYGKGKYLLRHAFEDGYIDEKTGQRKYYLPRDILYREKAAFSDAVGHSMVDYLKDYADSCYTDKEFETGCAKYGHARPFTKESLLYRDIFEKYYPGQSEMIVDFWMPNRNWPGCDVDDPSARVLANYGASGQ